jgi:hypothetical protein
VSWNGAGGGLGTDLLLSDGRSVTGDRLVLIPDKPPVIDFASEIQMRISGIPSLIVTNESVLQQPLSLSFTRERGKIILQWPGSGVLQQSSDLMQWVPVPSAASPFTVSTDGDKKYYRILESN